MISQEFAELLPPSEEEEEAIGAFLQNQPNRSADEEEITHFLRVFHREVVMARFTLGALENLKLGMVTLTLDRGELRWGASEKARFRGID